MVDLNPLYEENQKYNPQEALFSAVQKFRNSLSGLSEEEQAVDVEEARLSSPEVQENVEAGRTRADLVRGLSAGLTGFSRALGSGQVSDAGMEQLKSTEGAFQEGVSAPKTRLDQIRAAIAQKRKTAEGELKGEVDVAAALREPNTGRARQLDIRGDHAERLLRQLGYSDKEIKQFNIDREASYKFGQDSSGNVTHFYGRGPKETVTEDLRKFTAQKRITENMTEEEELRAQEAERDTMHGFLDEVSSLYSESTYKGFVYGHASEFANWLGMSIDQKATLLKKKLDEELMTFIRNASGLAVTDQERKALSRLFPSVSQSEEVFKQSVKTLKDSADRLVEKKRKKMRNVRQSVQRNPTGSTVIIFEGQRMSVPNTDLLQALRDGAELGE